LLDRHTGDEHESLNELVNRRPGIAIDRIGCVPPLGAVNLPRMLDSRRDARRKLLKIVCALLVMPDMPCKEWPDSLITVEAAANEFEVQEKPEFKAGIRPGEIQTGGPRTIDSSFPGRVVVPALRVDYTPDLIERCEPDAFLGVGCSLLPESNCFANNTNDLGALSHDLDVKRAQADRTSQRPEVIRLGLRSFANDQDTLARLASGSPSSESTLWPHVVSTSHSVNTQKENRQEASHIDRDAC
jgi:hypothetical protein